MKNLLLLASAVFILTSCGGGENTDAESTDSTAAEVVRIEPSELLGAWETRISEDGSDLTVTSIFSEKYFTQSIYTQDPPSFVATAGGAWEINGDIISFTFEYNTSDTTVVGTIDTAQIRIAEDGTLTTNRDPEIVWTKIDDGTPGELNGAWLITGRQRDGEITRRTPGARKTMKILSGTKFQWIAYNVETTRFSGTGGGSYTTVDGKYTENIEFFSRDSSRVGASLQFDYKIDSGEWHHSGLNSRGEPLYEIWTKREDLDNN